MQISQPSIGSFIFHCCFSLSINSIAVAFFVLFRSVSKNYRKEEKLHENNSFFFCYIFCCCEFPMTEKLLPIYIIGGMAPAYTSEQNMKKMIYDSVSLAARKRNTNCGTKMCHRTEKTGSDEQRNARSTNERKNYVNI